MKIFKKGCKITDETYIITFPHNSAFVLETKF